MFEPRPNALYAAKFLLELYREKGNWSGAAGAYHSRTPKYAEKYEARFNRFRNGLMGNDARKQMYNWSTLTAACAGYCQDQ